MTKRLPRVLAKSTTPFTPALKARTIASLVALGIWDLIPMQDKEALFERAEVLDTEFGREYLMPMVLKTLKNQ